MEPRPEDELQELERRRQALGWTYNQLAARANLSVAYVHQLLHGRRSNPTAATLKALRKALGLPVTPTPPVPPLPAETASQYVARRLELPAAAERHRLSSGPWERAQQVTMWLLEHCGGNEKDLAAALRLTLGTIRTLLSGRIVTRAALMHLGLYAGLQLDFFFQGRYPEPDDSWQRLFQELRAAGVTPADVRRLFLQRA